MPKGVRPVIMESQLPRHLGIPVASGIEGENIPWPRDSDDRISPIPDKGIWPLRAACLLGPRSRSAAVGHLDTNRLKGLSQKKWPSRSLPTFYMDANELFHHGAISVESTCSLLDSLMS